jgi:DNA-binding MarR family transcriptional regulator
VLAARAPCTANELAQALDQVPSAVTRLLDKLEALGCVRREPHAQDRRALQIVLTDQGRQLWARLQKRGDQTMDDAMRDLSADERALLLSLMTRVRDSLNTP